MASKFPITYSETIPSGRAAAIEAPRVPRMDVDTGAEQLLGQQERRGVAIAGLGKDLFEMAMKIQDQQDIVESSEFKRQVDEMHFAAFNSVTGNAEVDANTWSKLQEDLGKLQPKSNRVKNRIDMYINEVMPEWKQAYDKHTLGKWGKNVEDEQKTLETHYYETGDLDKFSQLQYSLTATERQGQIETDNKIADFQKMAVLHQAKRAIGENRLQDPNIAYLSNPEFRKNLSDKQLDYADDLVKASQEGNAKLKDQIENSIFTEMDTYDSDPNSTIAGRKPLAIKFDSMLTAKGLATREMRNYIDTWQKGEDATTDDEVYDKLDDRVTLWQTGRTDESKDTILTDLRTARFIDKTVSEADFRGLKNRLGEAELTKLDAHYLAEARALLKDVIITDLGMLYGQDAEQAMEYRTVAMSLEEEVRSGKLTGKAIWDRASELAGTYTKDPLGRTMETMRKYKENLVEMKKRKGEEEGAPQREGVPADKVKNFLRSKGWGG